MTILGTSALTDIMQVQGSKKTPKTKQNKKNLTVSSLKSELLSHMDYLHICILNYLKHENPAYLNIKKQVPFNVDPVSQAPSLLQILQVK